MATGALDANGVWQYGEDDALSAPNWSGYMNKAPASISALLAALGTWTSYTPSLGSGITVGNGTLVSRYSRIGKVVHVRNVLTFGSTTAITSGNTGIGYPVAANLTAHPVNTVLAGSAMFYDASAASHIPGYVSDSTATTQVFAFFGTGTITAARLSATVPVAFAAGDVLTIAYSYEAA